MEENGPTTERTKEIGSNLKQLAKTLKTESKDTDNSNESKELNQLAQILEVVAASTKTKFGISLISLQTDMFMSRELFLALREKEKTGEIPPIDDILGLNEDEDEDDDL